MVSLKGYLVSRLSDYVNLIITAKETYSQNPTKMRYTLRVKAMDWRKKTVEIFLCVTAASSLVRWKLRPPCRPIRCNYNFITPGFIRNLTYSFTSCDIGCCNYTLSTLSDVISVWLKGVQDTSEELICTNPVKSGFKGDDLTKKRSEPELIHSEPVKSHILSFLLQWLIKNFIGIIQAISFLQFPSCWETSTPIRDSIDLFLIGFRHYITLPSVTFPVNVRAV